MPDKIGREQFAALLQFQMTPANLKLVMKAYRFSKSGHKNQQRDNGVRYFEHPKSVALLLIQELGICDYEMIIAALLHDTVEDTFIFGSFEDAFDTIQEDFGPWVADCIRLLSKEKIADKLQRDTRYLEGLHRADLRMKIIKIADRIHNLRELAHCTSVKKQHYLEETEAHYLPFVQEVMAMVSGPLLRKLHEIHKEMEVTCEITRKSLSGVREVTHESR